MAQIDDELAIRKVLAEMTTDQPPAPPARYAAVRRRAIVHRRLHLAGAAAAVAILVAAAIAIPLGLMRISPPPPVAPSRHYHVSEYPPTPHSRSGLVAYGVLNHWRWSMFVTGSGLSGPEATVCWGTTYASAGANGNCAGPPTPANDDGAVASIFSSVGTTEQVDVGNVSSDVSYLRVFYGNGQVLTVRPVAVFGRQYARFFALAAPYSAAVTEVAAYSRTGELAYAIPFDGDGSIGLNRWIPPGQPALPQPASAVIGSGVAFGGHWHLAVYIGPWGTCFADGPTTGSSCSDRTHWTLGRKATVGVIGMMLYGNTSGYWYGQARSGVAYLRLTTARGQTTKVDTVTVDGTSFFAFAGLTRDPAVRWVAYDAAGRRLAVGRVPAPDA